MKKRVTLPHTEFQWIRSSFNQEDYSTSVALPYTYDQSNTSYPVLFILDDALMFAMVVQMVRALQVFHEIPDMVLVGVGYPMEEAADLWALRMRDYTPTIDVVFVASFSDNYGLPLTSLPVASGGSARFLDFLSQDLILMLETRYQLDSERRILCGWSFRGLFAFYSLFHRPRLFQAMVALSPSLWWDGGTIFQIEAACQEQYAAVPVRLEMGVGGREGESMRVGVKKMASVLSSRDRAMVQLETAVLEGESHMSILGGGFSRGLRFLFGTGKSE